MGGQTVSTSIERCNEDDVTDAMRFIDEHWRKDHILARRRDLLDWQHRCSDGKYNLLLAKNGTTIVGILGYIPASRFEADMHLDDVVWLALWKVRTDVGHAGLGLAMLRKLGQLHPRVTLAVNGIHPSLLSMYRALGYTVGSLRQFYMLNSNVGMKLVKDSLHSAVLPREGRAVFLRLDRDSLSSLNIGRPETNPIPAKTPAYFARRFLDHPYYEYQVYSIVLDDLPRAIIAVRVDQHDGAKALRIVDFAGDAAVVGQCDSAFDALLCETGAEYVDFWNHGLAEDDLHAAGFTASGDESPIIPSYFEPFVPSRACIHFAIKAPDYRTPMIFKADGDQDRPNLLD
jgi:hypothetical protein